MCSERPIEVIIVIVIGVENKNIERRLCCWAAQRSNSFSTQRENNYNTPGYRHRNESLVNRGQPRYKYMAIIENRLPAARTATCIASTAAERVHPKTQKELKKKKNPIIDRIGLLSPFLLCFSANGFNACNLPFSNRRCSTFAILLLIVWGRLSHSDMYRCLRNCS